MPPMSLPRSQRTVPARSFLQDTKEIKSKRHPIGCLFDLISFVSCRKDRAGTVLCDLGSDIGGIQLPQSVGAVRESCFCEILASLYGEDVDAVEDFAKQVGGPVFCYIEGGGDGAYGKAADLCR